MRLRTIFGLIAAACLAWFQCGNNNITGNTSEVGNATAMLYNPGGTPAVNVKVRFYPISYNPRAGLPKCLAAMDSAVTDSKGNYTAQLDTGTYNVLAAGDSGVVYQDSITVVPDSTIQPPADTLKAPGSMRGVVRLQPGDDARTVFILFMGTHTWGTPDDAIGNFSVADMAEGSYHVRILTTLDLYLPKDTTLSVTASKLDTLPHDIVLQYTGIPVPSGLAISYDTMKQIVTLTWETSTTGRPVAGYNIYRKHQDSTSYAKIAGVMADTLYVDSSAVQDQTYEYRVAAVDSNGTEGVKSASQTLTAASAFFISDTVLTIGGYGTLYAVELDNSGNYVIVNSTANQSAPARIERYRSAGTLINSWEIPNGVEASYVFKNIEVDDSGFIYVITKNNEVIKYDSTGTLASQFQFPGTARGFTLFKDTLYIGNTESHAIVAYSTGGDSLFAWGQDGQGNGQFNNIISLQCDSSGAIYVEDAFDFGRMQIFERNGAFRSSFDFRQFARTSGRLDLNAAQIDIKGSLMLVAGQAYNLYGFTTDGQFTFRHCGISYLTRAFFGSDGNIMASTWTGQLFALQRR